MITPHLEKLIFEGKAFFKTFVAGGAKCTLNIGQDRFIVITDITYMPNQGNFFDGNAVNTQVSIYGEKGFNHYIFRNNHITLGTFYDPGAGFLNSPEYTSMQPVTINTFLLHTTQVGFSFINRGASGAGTFGVASVDNPGYLPPLDYGKDGDPGALGIFTDVANGTVLNQLTNRQGYALPSGTVTTDQLQFAATGGSYPSVDAANFFPILNVNYVEILGQPTNIGF